MLNSYCLRADRILRKLPTPSKNLIRPVLYSVKVITLCFSSAQRFIAVDIKCFPRFSNELFKGSGYVCYAFSKVGKTALEMREILKITFGDNVMVKTQTSSGFLCPHAGEL